MAERLRIRVHQPVHAQLLQDPRRIRRFVLIKLRFPALQHRVVDMVIKDPGRNHAFFRPLALHLLDRCIHIDHELKLQAVVQLRQVKFRFPGLIINDFQIQQIPVLAEIDPVDPPAQMDRLLSGNGDLHGAQVINRRKRHLKALRLEIALFELLGQRPDRAVHDPAHLALQIPVPGRTFHNGIAVLRRHIRHTFAYQARAVLV